MRKRKFDLRFNHVSLVYKKSNRNENLHKFKKKMTMQRIEILFSFCFG